MINIRFLLPVRSPGVTKGVRLPAPEVMEGGKLPVRPQYPPTNVKKTNDINDLGGGTMLEQTTRRHLGLGMYLKF